MKMKSCTYQSTETWSPKVQEEMKRKVEAFILSLKENPNSILGFLQSFTFPENFGDEQAEDLAQSLYDLYRSHGTVLLGGDTSGGPSLVITLVALLK